jgi:hypothetical protein
MSALSPQIIRILSRLWTGRLSTYRLHRHDEHREAMITEAMRYAGLRLETDLGTSPYWGERPLIRRAGVLLFLVDRGAVNRSVRNGRIVYEVSDGAEFWASCQASLKPYLRPTLEFIAALRREQDRCQPAAG